MQCLNRVYMQRCFFVGYLCANNNFKLPVDNSGKCYVTNSDPIFYKLRHQFSDSIVLLLKCTQELASKYST